MTTSLRDEETSDPDALKSRGDSKLGPQIAQQLRDQIIAGQLEADAPLRLAALAESMGVSTTPIREALTILERQGLATSQIHRGFRVAEITARDISDIYDVHAFVSQLLTERATRRLSDEDVDELERLDALMHEADARGESIAAADFNHQLHRAINLRAGSPLLVRFLGETTPFVVRRDDPDVPGWKQQRIEGHDAILVHLRARDGAKAGEAMGEHIRRAGIMASELAENVAAARERDDGHPPSRSRRGKTG